MSVLGKYNYNSVDLGSSIYKPQNKSENNSKSDNMKDIKMVMIGDSAVGKTSIVSRLIYNRFTTETACTIASAFSTIEREYDGQKYKLQIWDTAGQERFRSLIPMYVKNSKIAVFVFDLTSRSSLDNIMQFWFNHVTEIEPKCVKILLGNKADLAWRREIPKSEIEKYANEHDMKYLEVSAKETLNIKELFDVILSSVRLNNNSGNFENLDKDPDTITLNNGRNDNDNGFGCANLRCVY